MSSTLRHTRALCPACERVLPAALVERTGDVFLELRCPEHGAASSLYFRDAALFGELDALCNPVACCASFDCVHGAACRVRERRTMIYMINVTNNCNMTCEACLSGARSGRQEPYAPAAELVDPLPDAAGRARRPHAVFFGGEPTLHPELPQMIARAAARGYVPRIATNGIRLARRAYAERLAAAGLGWVFLHFDSLDDERNRRLRGRPMLQSCLSAMRNVREAGMKLQLGATVSADTLDEVGALLRFARDNGAFWISLYPAAEIERHGAAGLTYLADLVDALERQTDGQVARRDFLASATLWSRMFRLTGRANFRQKPTMLSLPVVVQGKKGLVPVNRLLGPLGAARRPAAAARLLRALPSLWDYERRPPAGDTLVINIQQFQSRSALDLEEAVHSLMSYAHRGSWYPFDVYNHLHRFAGDAAPSAERAACGARAAEARG